MKVLVVITLSKINFATDKELYQVLSVGHWVLKYCRVNTRKTRNERSSKQRCNYASYYKILYSWPAVKIFPPFFGQKQIEPKMLTERLFLQSDKAALKNTYLKNANLPVHASIGYSYVFCDWRKKWYKLFLFRKNLLFFAFHTINFCRVTKRKESSNQQIM